MKMHRKKNTATEMCAKFVADAKVIHGDKFDYSNVDYVNNQTKVNIVCPVHGAFSITPHAHKQGRGCRRCFLESLRDTQSTIILKFREVHGDIYDYSLVNFKSRNEKVSIICKKHGVFQQTPLMHRRGHNCPQCANELRFGVKYDINDFINRYEEVHSEYIFQSLERIGKRTILTAICNKHGIFKQDASMALSGRGCKQCGAEKSVSAAASVAYDTSHFIKLATEKHNNTYDYSGVNYINCHTPVNILCKKHGIFLQTPSEHLRGSGCSSCGVVTSRWQIEISKLFQDCEILINDRKAIKPYEIDIYVPKYKFGIECHGYYWHSYNEKETHAQRYKHSNKHELAVKAGIKLLQIYDFEYENNTSLLESMIKYHCLSSIRVHARKCEFAILNAHEAKSFFDLNHIQGHRPTNYYLGLVYDNKIVCGISLAIRDEFEIIRFANLNGHSVVGGFSKLLKYAINMLRPKNIMTYADRRFSNGNLYSSNGFKLTKITEPGYRYISSNGSVVLSRYQCQKQKLSKLLKSYDPDKPEYQNMFDNGFRRIWDAGHYKFIMDL